ncbi:MAG: xanthine dehydrogenase family protein subunit M, partial [Deltaproteobacteria bacterium]|nr:xanthine dehydrogenase family protein subunit M [Deltaproteobacteria bacterium]
RKAMELPLLGIAVALRLSEKGEEIADARIALTVAAPTPVRAILAEDFLRGKPMTDAVLEEAGRIAASPECCSPRNSVRCEAWYRQDIIRVYVPRMARLAAQRIQKP